AAAGRGDRPVRQGALTGDRAARALAAAVTRQYRKDMTEKFDSLNPATGEVVASFPMHTAEDVADAVDKARGAADWWPSLDYAGRRKRLRDWRTLLVQRSDELADLMHRENGKPVDDALSEVILAIEHLSWAAASAGRVLGRHRVAPGMLA